MAYCTLAEIKESMPDASYDATYDAILTALADRASRLIDDLCGRDLGAFGISTASTRYYDGNGRDKLWVDEMAEEPVTVEVSYAGDGVYTALAVTDYTTWPYNRYPRVRIDLKVYGTLVAWPNYPQAVKITAKWGYSTVVPADIKQAAIIQAVRWFRRGQSGYADTGAVVELGQLRYTKELDPDVAAIVEIYKRVDV